MVRYYYPKTIRGIVLAVLDLFNDMTIVRDDDNGTSAKDFRVPLKFGPTDKVYQSRSEFESGKKYYLSVPGLALSLDGINYAAERATGVRQARYFPDNDDLSLAEFFTDIVPAPYDYEFTLHIMTESIDDFSQVMENILPYFNPSINLKVKEFSFLNIARDLNMVLVGINTEFLEPQDENNKRYVNGTISFSVKGYMYRPVSESQMIKVINTQYFVRPEDENILEHKYITSGFGSLSAISAVPSSAYQYSGTVDGLYYTTSGQSYS